MLIIMRLFTSSIFEILLYEYIKLASVKVGSCKQQKSAWLNQNNIYTSKK